MLLWVKKNTEQISWLRLNFLGHRMNVNDGRNFSVFMIFMENSHFAEHRRRTQKINSEPWGMKNHGMVRRRILLSTDWERVISSSLRPTGRCLSLNFWWGTSCSPSLLMAIKLTRKLIPYFKIYSLWPASLSSKKRQHPEVCSKTLREVTQFPIFSC